MSFKTIEIKVAPVSTKWSFELSEIDGRARGRGDCEADTNFPLP